MMNRSNEEAVSKQSKAFVSLKQQIESQKQKITNVEHKNSEKAACMGKLNESLNIVMQMMNKGNKLHEECQKELQEVKVMNSNMSHDMECLKKEHAQITKELEESKALNDLQQKNFAEEIQQKVMQISSLQMAALKHQNDDQNVSKLAEDLKVQKEQLNKKTLELEEQLKSKQKLELVNQSLRARLSSKIWQNNRLKEKIDGAKHMEDEFLKTVGALHMNILEKEQSIQDLEDFNQSLIIKERENNDELQNARKKLIEGITQTVSPVANIGVKRMGEVDIKPFLEAVSEEKRYYKKEAAELCSLWQKYVEDPHWYPFNIITVDGKSQEIINDQDEKLRGLKKRWGDEAYEAVVSALKEMNEYNPSGRFIVSELWNKREGRRATLQEVIEFLLSQTKTKRRKINQAWGKLGSSSSGSRNRRLPSTLASKPVQFSSPDNDDDCSEG